MKKIILSIDGMTCSACSNGLEKYLNKREGIKSATVNLVLANASIEYDETKLNQAKIEEFVKKAGFKSLGEFETNDQCLMDLEAGRTDAVVADEVIIRYYVSKKGEEKYKILEEDFGKEEYGIGVRQEDTALLEALNVALDELKENGTTKEISEKWFGSDIIME